MSLPTNSFDEKIRHCTKCNKDILIPRTQVGGFWHLSGWTDPTGEKHHGGVCSPCFTKLSERTVE